MQSTPHKIAQKAKKRNCAKKEPDSLWVNDVLPTGVLNISAIHQSASIPSLFSIEHATISQRQARNPHQYTNPDYYKKEGEEDDCTYFASEKEAWDVFQGPWWRPPMDQEGKCRPPKDTNLTLDEWQKYRCVYANTNNKYCRECRIAKSKQNSLFYIAFGNVQHNHTTGKFKKGLGIAVKAELFNSPSKVLKKRPPENIAHLAMIPEASMSRKEQSQAKSLCPAKRRRCTLVTCLQE
jgi:hypothetical protein